MKGCNYIGRRDQRLGGVAHRIQVLPAVASWSTEFDDNWFAVDFFSVHFLESFRSISHVEELDEPLVLFRRRLSQFLYRP